MSESSRSEVGASDESFYITVFSFVTMILAMVYLPVLCACCRKKNVHQEQREKMLSWPPRMGIFEMIGFCISSSFFLMRNPTYASMGCSVLMNRPRFTRKLIVPIVIKNILRKRVILGLVWFFLLSIVTYQKLSFDPYAVLGVERSATRAEIKRAYRTLSMLNHPDKNKTEAARIEYPRIVKANKLLQDPDTMEEEIQKDSGPVGEVKIGLPAFLFKKEWMPLVGLCLFSCLFGVPLYVIYILTRTTSSKVITIMDRIPWVKEEYDYMYQLMGEPPHDPDNPPPEAELATDWKNNYNPKRCDVAAFYIEVLNTYYRTNVMLPLVIMIRSQIPHLESAYKLTSLFQQQHAAKMDNLRAIRNEIDYQQNLHKNLVRQVLAPNKKLVKIVEDVLEKNYDLPNDDDEHGPPQRAGGGSRSKLTPKGKPVKMHMN